MKILMYPKQKGNVDQKHEEEIGQGQVDHHKPGHDVVSWHQPPEYNRHARCAS